MAKIQISKATDIQLNYLVAKCEGHDVVVLTVAEKWDRFCAGACEEEIAEMRESLLPELTVELKVSGDEGFKRTPTFKEAPMAFNAGPATFCYTANPLQTQPIIDREIDTIRKRSKAEEASLAHPNPNFKFKAEIFGDVDGYFCGFGPTSLIAAMRCYAISKLGDTAEVPDELV